ncbi:37091_t:CDS:2 [Gigaspora margarita]|uniref:37091_t:CDS:1 n=1 Tax=Gigaspora margarita TaxID=4874 RepID=A0ABN7UUB4_GIGMA|nr:37091_t:CDS:2 [Gigaspora margarita]
MGISIKPFCNSTGLIDPILHSDNLQKVLQTLLANQGLIKHLTTYKYFVEALDIAEEVIFFIG